MAIIVPIVSAWNPAGLNKALAELKRAEGSLNKFSVRAQDIGKSMQGVGMSLSTKVTLPLTLLGAVSVRTAADFQVAMAQVGVATNTPVSGLKGLSTLAKKMGADTIFSANEAAQAMLELAKAGISPAEIEAGSLKNTLDLAAASGMGLADSAVIMSAGMNTFKLGAKDSTKIVDALAGAANASAADVSDIALALQQVGQQAVASGLTIQETTAGLAAFADAGVRGSDAGTSFKTFLMRLNPVSKQAADEMKKLGLEFFDSAGNMKDLTEIAGQVKQGFSGLTQQQRLASMETIFGSDALRAANILYGQGAEGIAKYVQASTKQGAAADMASARNSGLAGAIEQMKGSLETASLVIGERLTPTVTALAGKIQGLANAFSLLSPQMQGGIVKFGLILAVIGPTILIVGVFITALGNIALALSLLGVKIASARASLVLLGLGFKTAGIAGVLAMTTIKGAMISTGVGALVVAIGFLIEKLYSAANAAKAMNSEVSKNLQLAKASDKQENAALKNVKNGLAAKIAALPKVTEKTNDYAAATGGSTKATKEAIPVNQKITATIAGLNERLKVANDALTVARDKFNNYKQSISQTVSGILNFGSAQSASTSLADAATQAQTKLADATVAYQKSLNDGSIKDQQTALENLAQAESDAANALSGRKSFIQILQDQAGLAATFAGKVQQLITMGLSQSAIGQVLAAGAEAGSLIADEIIAGGAGVVNKVNELVDATQSVADAVGESAAVQFYQSGLTAGQALVDGVKAAIAASGFNISVGGDVVNQSGIDRVNKQLAKSRKSGGKLTKKERKSITNLANSLGVEVPAMAKGGIVNRPTLALIGEAGPEAVVPLSGSNNPLGGGANITINVNAGMGSDGNQIGQQIVDAIKKYERTSGPVFRSA